MAKGLVIRATSTQHLPLVVKKVEEKFPGTGLDVLTHPHVVHSLTGLFNEENIILYPYPGCFGIKGLLKKGTWKRLKREKYDFVVVPVENRFGAGYENVVRAALTLRPRKIILVNRQGELTVHSPFRCFISLVAHTFLLPPAFLISCALTLYFMGRFTGMMLTRALLR